MSDDLREPIEDRPGTGESRPPGRPGEGVLPFDPADKTEPAEGGRDEVDESLRRQEEADAARRSPGADRGG